jgi:predicted nucleic acid-binding protein
MLLVIADTSPIRYLVQIGHIDLLHSLFQSVSIPTDVARELSDPSAPSAVQAWIKTPPGWLNVLDTAAIDDDPALNTLDPGERSAIALGISLKADLILIDERKGSLAAARKGFETTGTLGILDLAAKRKLIDLRDAIERLKQTNFRYRKDIIDSLLAQFKER